jgi:hypothetical protein
MLAAQLERGEHGQAGDRRGADADPAALEATAYFIVAEALTNAVRHAHAGMVLEPVRARSTGERPVSGPPRSGSGTA